MIITKNEPLNVQLNVINSNINDKAEQHANAKENQVAHAQQSYHRKTIFADPNGVLIAQKKDDNGEVISTYPSPEVLRRYQIKFEE